MQESLNCLMIFEIFSNLCWSSCCLASWWDMTKKVDLSNRTTSSACKVSQNVRRLPSRVLIFGSKKDTIWDQALYKVSSQIDVLKHSTSNRPSIFWTMSYCLCSKVWCRIFSANKSILWIKQKILVFGDSSPRASKQFSNWVISWPLKSLLVTSNT